MIVFILFPYISQAQLGEFKQFDITLAGFRVGSLEAHKSVRDSLVIYTANTTADFWLIVNVSIAHEVETHFHDSLLIRSVVNTSSHQGQFESTTVWDSHQYTANIHTYDKTYAHTLDQPVYSPVSQLYFEEPADGEMILSDTYGSLVPVVYNDTLSCYDIGLPGQTNQFFYEDGELVKAIMNHEIKNYEIRRAKD